MSEQHCLAITALRLAIALLAISHAIPASAQSAAGQDTAWRGSEILVTAQKREQAIEQVPASIGQLGTDNLVETGKNSFADYINTIPGLSVASGGPGLSTLAIRGITSGSVRNDETSASCSTQAPII